jgi:16S rRNA processing protein RimM
LNPEQTWVWLARIRKSQGRKGEVLADLLTDFPEKFKERKRVWLLSAAGTANESAREAELTGHFLHKGPHSKAVVLHFAGIASIPEADALRGQVVAIPRAERAALGEDEVYVGDLIGSLLVDVSGTTERQVGVIEDVDRDAGPPSLSPVALLVVAGPKKEEILVPFAKAYLRKIEPGRVEMALPEGLVDVQISPAGNPPPDEA